MDTLPEDMITELRRRMPFTTQLQFNQTHRRVRDRKSDLARQYYLPVLRMLGWQDVPPDVFRWAVMAHPELRSILFWLACVWNVPWRQLPLQAIGPANNPLPEWDLWIPARLSENDISQSQLSYEIKGQLEFVDIPFPDQFSNLWELDANLRYSRPIFHESPVKQSNLTSLSFSVVLLNLSNEPFGRTFVPAAKDTLTGAYVQGVVAPKDDYRMVMAPWQDFFVLLTRIMSPAHPILPLIMMMLVPQKVRTDPGFDRDIGEIRASNRTGYQIAGFTMIVGMRGKHKRDGMNALAWSNIRILNKQVIAGAVVHFYRAWRDIHKDRPFSVHDVYVQIS